MILREPRERAPQSQPTLDAKNVRGLTPQENVEKLRQNLAIVEARLRDAIERNDEGDIAIQQRIYKETVNVLRTRQFEGRCKESRTRLGQAFRFLADLGREPNGTLGD